MWGVVGGLLVVEGVGTGGWSLLCVVGGVVVVALLVVQVLWGALWKGLLVVGFIVGVGVVVVLVSHLLKGVLWEGLWWC